MTMKETRRSRKARIGAAALAMSLALLPKLTYGANVRAEDTDEIAIDETNFPDAYFRANVSDPEIDTDGNGKLSETELSAVTSWYLTFNSISDLTGIEYFTSLKELYCSNNPLTSLDLSKNTALEILEASITDLTTLDLSKCANLKKVSVFQSQLTSLDVSACTELTYLDLETNQVTALSLSENPKIEYLYCTNNQLTSLDVTKCTALKQLYCDQNKLTSLDVTNCTALQELYCDKNELTSLDVTKNTSLLELDCSNNPIGSIQVGACWALGNLNVKNCGLTELDLSMNPDLYYLNCNSNSLTTLDLSVAKGLFSLRCAENQLTSLDVTNEENLETLICYANRLTELDLSKNTKLSYLDCENNQISEIDLSNNTSLTTVLVYGNKLTTLDVSNLEYLFWLGCSNNQLRSINLEGCENLERLYAENNKLSALDLSDCPNVFLLTCEKNTIAKLNINNCVNLLDLMSACPLETVTDNGYEYCQYYYDKDSRFSFDKNIQIVTDAVPGEATVTFDGNGASGSVAPITVTEGTTITLPENGFTAPAGYTFAGWEVGQPGEAYGVSVTQTVKAVWQAIDFTITVTSDGNGSASASAATAAVGTQITLTATPNSGYQFKQWQVIAGGVTLADGSLATTTFTMGTANVEIKAIFEAVATPEPQPATPEPQPATPTPEPEKDPSFEDFVERLYTVALGRASEAEGKAYWVDQVVNKGLTGADCARFFMLGAPEFLGRNLSDDQFVEVLYQTYFDRESEPDGKAYWMGRLASGTERAVLVEEFIESVEWCNVCATYGVKSGALYHKATIPSKNAVKFATRLYTCCLGRDPEAEGLEYWALALTNLDATGYQAASLFFTLPEFLGLNTTNEEYLRRLYTTFMGRDPEEEGFNYWLSMLNGGTDRNEVMRAFAGCAEFQEICNQYGIVRGEI